MKFFRGYALIRGGGYDGQKYTMSEWGTFIRRGYDLRLKFSRR